MQFQSWLCKTWRNSQNDSTLAPPKDPFQLVFSISLEQDTGDKTQTDGLADPIIAALLAWFWQIYPGNEISEVLKECLHPNNCEALKPVTINDEVQKLMSPSDKVDGQWLKWLENGIVKAASPLATAWNMLLQLEYNIRSKTCNMNNTLDPEVDFMPPDAMVPLNKENDLNLSEVIHHIKLSLKMLGFCHIQAMQK